MICPFVCHSTSLPPSWVSSLACGPRDVVLINSPHCTLIKLPVIGPAPSFPPGAHQDGSIRKQLQIYGTAVTAPRLLLLLTVRVGVAGQHEACNSNRAPLRALLCGLICKCIFVRLKLPSQSSIFPPPLWRRWFAIAARNKVQSFLMCTAVRRCAYCSAVEQS